MTRVVSQAREVERGVWIREQWLREAGLAGQVQIIVRPREIRIQEVARETSAEQEQPSERGLQILVHTGQYYVGTVFCESCALGGFALNLPA